MKLKRGRVAVAAVGFCVFALAGTAHAADRQGFYAGIELGFANPLDMDYTVSGINHPTRCDQLLGSLDGSGEFVRDPDVVDLSDPACQVGGERPLTDDTFNMEVGFMGGFYGGYALNAFRVELEYLHRAHDGERKPFRSAGGNAALGSKADEWSDIDPPSERVSDFRANQYFVNAYYDFLNNSRWTPYVGAGVGWSRVSLTYSNRFVRKTLAQGYQSEAADSSTRPAAAAGSVSRIETDINQTLFGFQFMGGVDYALTENVSFGLKGRWAEFQDLEGRDVWDLIRSHDPVRADGTPFTTTQSFENIGYWALSFGVKYHF